MSITNAPLENQAPVLLEVFKQYTINNLYEAMLSDIKPKLMEAAKAAAKELEGSINAMHDRYQDKIIVQINIKTK